MCHHSSFSAILVSVGGAPAPVLHVLRQHRPANVWYFCSEGSRINADDIQAQLDWHPQARFIEVKRFEELGPCYRELRRTIPAILAEKKIHPSEVLVDYTGGTKTMSAAVVLAASELFDQFSYVGGEQREKGGLGVTVDGRERVLYQTNPWSDLAIREVERARDLWKGCQFEAAANTLQEVSKHVPQRLRFEAIAGLADAMAARHRLDFHTAVTGLGPLIGKLPALFDGREDHGLIEWVKDALQICVACSKSMPDELFLRELLDNTLRTANQGRFEDAAARLYRAMEMRGQIWLTDATENLFVNGRCKKENVMKIPDAMKSLPFCQPNIEGGVKLSLEHLYLALAALGHEKATAIAHDISLDKNSRWRIATENRNASILAHGVQSIGETGFVRMKEFCSEFLGFDLDREMKPILPMDARWLE